MQAKRNLKEIKIYPQRCSGCLCCQLVCSFTFSGRFNLTKSRIVVSWPGDMEKRISLTDDCTYCGLCVQYCNFGALELVKEVT